jgi:hypothetical protein
LTSASACTAPGIDEVESPPHAARVRLAGRVRPEKPEDRARCDLEIEAVERMTSPNVCRTSAARMAGVSVVRVAWEMDWLLVRGA